MFLFDVIFNFLYIYALNISISIYQHYILDDKLRGDVMVKVIDCGIVISEFVLQLRYYVHFQANTLGKGMNPLTLPAMG